MATKVSTNGNTPRQIEMIEVERLHFDPENPRLPTTMKGKGEQEILKWMLRKTDIIELMGSIAEKGYFASEPLLAVPAKAKGQYYAVEGNRRLCAVKLLRDPSSAPIRKQAIAAVSKGAKAPTKLPAIIYENRDQILGYLGYRHITGIKQWDPLAKARYLKQLERSLGKVSQEERYTALAKSIGSNSNYVGKLLTGVALYERIASKDFFDIEGLTEESVEFSLLTTALSWKNIREFLGLQSYDPSLKGVNEENLKYLTEWLFKDENGSTRLVESRNLTTLSAIVKSPSALAALKTGRSIADAEVLAGVPVDIFRKAVHSALKMLQDAQNETLHRVSDFTPADSQVLSDVSNIARNMKVVVDEQLAVRSH